MSNALWAQGVCSGTGDIGGRGLQHIRSSAGQGEQVIHGRAVCVQMRKELSVGPRSQDRLPECRVWYNLEEEVEFR